VFFQARSKFQVAFGQRKTGFLTQLAHIDRYRIYGVIT
jgi:hypothetical protein